MIHSGKLSKCSTAEVYEEEWEAQGLQGPAVHQGFRWGSGKLHSLEALEDHATEKNI